MLTLKQNMWLVMCTQITVMAVMVKEPQMGTGIHYQTIIVHKVKPIHLELTLGKAKGQQWGFILNHFTFRSLLVMLYQSATAKFGQTCVLRSAHLSSQPFCVDFFDEQ